jgi:uncharacterized C2H2 Zn-finger protein
LSVEGREPEPFSSDFDKAKRAEPIAGQVKDAQFRCQVCGQVFLNKADLEEHVKSHEQVEEKIENEENRPAGVS